jgi:predicted helicase
LNQLQSTTKTLTLQVGEQLASALALEFVPFTDPEGNVCLAGSDEVRDEYRTSFTELDVAHYLRAVMHSPEWPEKNQDLAKIEPSAIPLPKSATHFWQLVRMGQEIAEKK